MTSFASPPKHLVLDAATPLQWTQQPIPLVATRSAPPRSLGRGLSSSEANLAPAIYSAATLHRPECCDGGGSTSTEGAASLHFPTAASVTSLVPPPPTEDQNDDHLEDEGWGLHRRHCDRDGDRHDAPDADDDDDLLALDADTLRDLKAYFRSHDDFREFVEWEMEREVRRQQWQTAPGGGGPPPR